MAASATLLTRQSTSLDLANVSHGTSREISRLLLHAINCVDRDEAVTIDLVKKASILLRPEVVAGKTTRVPVSGLAPWQGHRLTRFVEERISYPISLEELATLVRLSTSYFTAAFKVHFGTTPHNYILSRRVEYAKHRMLTSNASLCEIALDCGFADQSHLSRVFRRATGTTPSAWRRYAARPAVPQFSAR